jgi:hypothetical protein
MSTTSRATVGFGIFLALVVVPRVASAQLRATGTASAALFMHQVDIGYGVEESTGLVFGVEGAVDIGSRLVLAVHAAGGSLSTQAISAQNRDVGEVGVRTSVLAKPWLAVFGGATSRTYSTAIARQRWTTVEIGAQAHADFATIPVRGVLQGAVVPVVSVSGLPHADPALTAAAGLEYRTGTLTGGMFYGLERYDFPGIGAGRRLEQVSTLSFRFSVQRRTAKTAGSL